MVSSDSGAGRPRFALVTVMSPALKLRSKTASVQEYLVFCAGQDPKIVRGAVERHNRPLART